MPLLASYFATGTDSLRASQALSFDDDDSLGDLLEYVQLRVLLASSERLISALHAVLRRPAFRYRRVRSHSAGVVRGRLDVLRYLRERHEVSAPRTFPIQQVNRSYLLPENVLACWAALTVANALKRLPMSRLPEESPERRRAERTSETVRRLAHQPALDECRERAFVIWRDKRHDLLCESVRSRIWSGRMPSAGAYQMVVDWVTQFDLRNLSLELGEVAWLFYDATFDTRLFELWSLHQLSQSISKRIGQPETTRLLIDRRDGPVFLWSFGSIRIEAWYQAGLNSTDIGKSIWYYDPRQRDDSQPKGNLGGIPDITIVVQQPGNQRTPVLIDPKLRRRESVPTDEIYKILGYFGNLPSCHPRRGAIVFYGPSHTQRSYRLADGQSGVILALAVDPVDDSGTQNQFDDLADLVISSIPQSTALRGRGPDNTNDSKSVERWVDGVQRAVLSEMMADIDEGSLAITTKSVRANLIGTWDRLDRDTQRMLATAEHFGSKASADMDHSGPTLGLAAACERLLRDVAHTSNMPASTATFGRLIQRLRSASLPTTLPADSELRAALMARAVNLEDALSLAEDLFALNHDFRIPAAHSDIVEEGQWIEARARILLGQGAALVKIVDVLVI